jgi:hypothetical protein
MYRITLLTVGAVLAFYGALFVLIRMIRPRIAHEERKTLYLVGGTWAVSVFVANYLLARADLMSFMPWTANFMHTFLWIGVCLSWLYLGVREDHSMAAQMLVFSVLSLVVKQLEHAVFGTWEHGHFFRVFQGNAAYVLGWSLADGLYPPITLFGLRLLGRFVPGLIVV